MLGEGHTLFISLINEKFNSLCGDAEDRPCCRVSTVIGEFLQIPINT